MADQAGWLEDKYEEISDRHRLAKAFEGLSSQNGSFALLNRYQARLHREYQGLLKALIELQAARHARQPKIRNERAPQRRKPPVGESPTPRRCRCTGIASEPDRRVTAGMGAS
jgi:hypothetical protein